MARVLVVLEDVVRAHAERRRPGLLQRRPCEASVQPEEPRFGVDCPHAVDGRFEALVVPRVVDESCLDAFRGCHAEDASHHSCAHAR